MNPESIKLEPSWKEHLLPEFQSPYMDRLKRFLVEQIAQKKAVYPRGEEYFAALNQTPFDQVKVVILGQDPYHGPGQAHGLCFSVRPGVTIPPSLVNIYKELKADVGFVPPRHGNLEYWARQGVLLLNAVLTVEQGRPASHQNQGWEQFTDAVIRILNEEKTGLVFVLWGAYAQRKGRIIDRSKHLVLESVHPSPLSANRGFFGCKHFSKINEYLRAQGKTEIDWQLPLDVH